MMAKTYPNSTFTGFDFHKESIEKAAGFSVSPPLNHQALLENLEDRSIQRLGFRRLLLGCVASRFINEIEYVFRS
jgi:hypothetical protein